MSLSVNKPFGSISFNNSYVNVAETLFTRQLPTPVKTPELIRVNQQLAESLGINPSDLLTDAAAEVFAGNQIPQGAEPIATAYAGHQFGSWNPQLGDGRAILLGEVIGVDQCRYDIQLKGAGRTAYSRGGDGRSPLGPVLREYIVSEAMAAMGIATTRSLAAVTTGETVLRDAFLPGAILTRVAKSHIRIGTFQYFAARQDIATLTSLADHVIERHFGEIAGADNPYFALLCEVIKRQASLIAQWQSVGFIHGVMNTDNMLVSGETVDYGPCAFMDSFDPAMVYSSIDSAGRYAYQNQPSIAQWNLMCLAQSLLPLLSDSKEQEVELAQQALDGFNEYYQAAYNSVFHNKLGFTEPTPESINLIQELLALMAEHQVDFTLGFRALADCVHETPVSQQSVAALYQLPVAFDGWIKRWLASVLAISNPSSCQTTMYSHNPVFIPRNHLVEEAIVAATDSANFQPFHDLVDLLATPYGFKAEKSQYALPPRSDQLVAQTFCGT